MAEPVASDTLQVLFIGQDETDLAAVRRSLPKRLALAAPASGLPPTPVALTEVVLSQSWEISFMSRRFDLGLLALRGKAVPMFLVNHAALHDRLRTLLFLVDDRGDLPADWPLRRLLDDVMVRPFSDAALRLRLEHLLCRSRLAPADTIDEARLLDFLRGRLGAKQRVLAPAFDPLLPAGFFYPAVAEAFGPAVDDVGLLDRLAGLGACRKLVAERLQACPACGSQQLGFRQACPRCGALDFTRVAVIRHPACGHQAERGAFTNGPRLVCPGCGQELRPDGHDHELQAAACLCHACAAIAAEPAVQAVCRHCGQLTPPEDTVEHVVYAYELTPLADEAVAGNRLSGVDLAVVLRDRPHGFYAKPYFLHEVTRELARFRRYRSPFSLLVVRLNHLAPIRANQPARVAAYLDHLFTSIGRDLRNLDLICVWGADLLAVLLPETGLDGAQALAKRMIARAEQADPHHDRKGPILSAAAITCNAEDEDPERLLAEAQASLVGASEP